MVWLHYSILIFLFSEFRIDLVSANQSTRKISAIIQSYADTYTTVKPEETRYITTQTFPKIEKQDRGYVHDFEKTKYDNESAFPNVPIIAAASSPEYASFKDFSSTSIEDSNESSEPEGPADHVIPFSKHENPKEPPTRPNYTAPGNWAKPLPEKNIPLDFVPTKLYAQVRDSHTVKHVPRKYAMESTESSEEKENASRLKEVVKESKANTIYTEEGYEDAAYDHAGHIRDADFQENFARKFNEELENKNAYSGKRKKPKTLKKHKPREQINNNRDEFADNNKSQSEVVEGTLTPKHLRILKGALNQPVINPKLTAESGIIQLEKDLHNEYHEAERTSTEPYTHMSTMTPITYKPTVTESVFQTKMDVETTTTRRNVFTIRPKKTIVTITPKPYRNKLKNPLKAFSVSKTNDNYNAYTTSSYTYEPTQLPAITYPPPQFEQQTVNPLAVATVNGHGPYLVVVTSSPDTSTPRSSESQNSINSVGYSAGDDYNVTKQVIVNANSYHNPFIPVNRKVNNINYDSNPHGIYIDNDDSEPVFYGRGEFRQTEKIPMLKHLKSQSFSEGSPDYFERDRDVEYYAAVQSPKTYNVPIAYSNQKRKSYANFFDQWPETYENDRLVEDDGSDIINRPPITLEKPKVISPVTKLLPPAPLSASEYATFQRQNKGSKPISPNVMAMMPIIDAIHKHENEEKTFPFLFRRKRSTFGFFRSSNFKPRERRHQEIDTNKNVSQHSKYLNSSKHAKYPENFHFLLNESIQVTSKEIDAEIQKHFKNGTKPLSNDSSTQSSKEPARITSDKNLKTSLDDMNDFTRGETVDVQVPELEFTNVFKKDEIESSIENPSVNIKKYPYYKDINELKNTALKYMVNPKEIPRKTLGGMEFYNSRVRECEEVNPNLEKIIPEDDEIENKRGPQKKNSRLHGLGDKIDCYKAKYFDETPFDNPLFIEKDVEMPALPTELNPKKFASRILELPTEKDDYAVPKGPKNPEFVNVKRGIKLRRPLRDHITEQNLRHHLDKKLRKPNLVNTNLQRHRYLPINPVSNQDKRRPTGTRSKMKIKTNNLNVVPRYQRLVYEDIMGNIMNLEKFQKSHVPKRGVSPLYVKHYKRDNNREQGITGFKKSNNVLIGGLVPPPQKITDKLVNNKHRYNFTDVQIKNLRIYKRSINLNYQNLSSIETDDKVDKNNNSKFRIVFTTPLPNYKSFKKQLPDSNKINVTIAKNMSRELNESPRHSSRSGVDPGRYGKFLSHKHVNSAFETKRKEPKYNNTEKGNFSNETMKSHGDVSFESSTSIPVVINLYKNFTARIPRGSKNNQAKYQVAGNPDYNKHTDKLIEQEEDPKKQFIVFDPVQYRSKNMSNGADKTTYTSTPNIQDHEELVEFLKGNPPGYDEAFAEEVELAEDNIKELYKAGEDKSDIKTLPKSEEVRNGNLETQDSFNNEEFEDHTAEIESEEPDLNEQKDAYVEEKAPDGDSDKSEENVQSDGDGEKSLNDDVQDDKHFVRFSSRPHSPPESYEDERYADLGPRVNKPYFYHPPFDVPTYEKYTLGKLIDHSGDDYGHEENEYPEKYVFPWERDDEDVENKEESKHHSVLDRYEYPWEKRDRRERERQKREKTYNTHKKDRKENIVNHGNDNYRKSNNTAFILIPSNDHLRDKKDVNALQNNSENHSSKFSSKYKSVKIKDLEANDQNGDNIEKSILKYITNTEMPTPIDKNVYTTPRINIKGLVNQDIASNTLNKSVDELQIDSNTEKSLITLSSSNLDGDGSVNWTPNVPTNRTRGRSRRINMDNHKYNENKTISSNLYNLRKVQPTISSKITRQKGRNRGSVATLTTTTTTTAKPNNRRRTRLTSTTTTTTTTNRTTPKSVHEKRRRSFRTIPYMGTTTSPTIPTNRTVEREHRSRVSKEMIITKTVEDNDDDDSDEDSNKNISSQSYNKAPSKGAEHSRSKIRRRHKTKTNPDENPPKKERVEKVTITMEETPDHVYETKEIDKDGIKGKFITITSNNNSIKAVPTKRNHDRTVGVDDAELEEMQRRMEASKSFDSVIQDTEDLGDEPESLRMAEKYVVGSLLQKLPLPLSRTLTGEKEDNKTRYSNNENEDEDDDQDEDDDGDGDDDDEEVNENNDEDTDKEELRDEKSNQESYRNNNTESIEKDPNNRNYFYVD